MTGPVVSDPDADVRWFEENTSRVGNPAARARLRHIAVKHTHLRSRVQALLAAGG